MTAGAEHMKKSNRNRRLTSLAECPRRGALDPGAISSWISISYPSGWQRSRRSKRIWSFMLLAANPNSPDLSLPVGHVEFHERSGVRVNEYLQSVSNAAVYAAGDAAKVDCAY